MNYYDVDVELVRTDGSIYKDTIIAEASTPERARGAVESLLNYYPLFGGFKEGIKILDIRLRSEIPDEAKAVD